MINNKIMITGLRKSEISLVSTDNCESTFEISQV